MAIVLKMKEEEEEEEISYYHCRRYNVFLQIVAFDMLSRCNFYFGSFFIWLVVTSFSSDVV